MCGPDSAVGIANPYGMDGPDRIPVGGEIFRTRPDKPGAQPASNTMGTELSPGGEKSGRWPPTLI
jgi:hypothetical protein